MDNLEQKVYAKEVLEFTAVANEYCAFVETTEKYNGESILKFMQKLLPLLYSKTLSLPEFESLIDEEQVKYVKEEDWQGVHDSIIVKLGEANDYLEAAEDQSEFGEELLSSSIAENLADIYQDLKDFLIAYSLGTVDLMNEALWNCQDNFKIHWGKTLVNSLRAVHLALRFPEKIGSTDSNESPESGDMDTSDWIISKRQSQLRKDEDNDI